MTPKKQMNVRISDYTRQQVEALQAHLSLGEEPEPQTRVIAAAIDRMYKQEFEMARTRKFEYVGEPTLTRGDFGEGIRNGYELDNDGMIHVWDSTFGWFSIISIDAGIESGDWLEKSKIITSFAPRDGKLSRPSTRCSSGQNVFDAAEERFGKGAYVDLSCNASHFMPNPETVTAYGPPIGEVTVRPRESFWVYTSK